MSKGYIVLQDGKVFTGTGFGATGKSIGEIVFNTSMMGYQESLTDPASAGKIINFTYPLIGNYGVNFGDWESSRIFAHGVVVKEAAEIPSNWRSEQSLPELLKEHNIVGVEGVDTRAITKYIRSFGSMRAIVANDGTSVEELKEIVKSNQLTPGQENIKDTTTKSSYSLPGGVVRLVVMDFGIKSNVLRILQKNNCTINLVSADTSGSEILKSKPQGVILSNGPENNLNEESIINELKIIIEAGVPIFGIGVGHQLLAKALGATTYKLKFGHCGSGPVKEVITNKVYMTSQNNGFVVDANSLSEDIEVTYLNLNDNTVAGIRHKKLPIMSVQFHPEASPGPKDTEFIFQDFLSDLEKGGN
ncbi:carbamoyl-phosphate synthase small subunit [Desulfonispora thiosulfatigenes DSM 11270]|uniref:Carbamoyl phosphate synthase small chain n=1 Tax=Desulfonispora thiosulfatigenes DSM 11270 TaxID=656914 RepID=A0A1W1VHQ8_DESTI|nr:glutamine-hydrolyzing carbamoyl-phosphate synthase small subunit [Desulfonispora thiosulfatigenes]SMB92591.1 carbamoyl-phosphate synthase small subunit [Desulfonispora thiosulfatigenes DSM 11270]